MPTEEELFASIDALLEEPPQLPPPAERTRLREAAGITQARLAQALKASISAVKNYENGRSEPKSPRLEAYQRLLKGWAEKYPAAEPDSSRSGRWPADREREAQTEAGPGKPSPECAEAPKTRPDSTQAPSEPEAAETAPTQAAPARTTGQPTRPGTRPASSRRHPAKNAARPAADPRYPHGALAVLDGDGSAYTVTGTALDCPATTVPELVEWTLNKTGIGAARLHKSGKDSDPLIVVTASAAARLGLPERLEDRRGLRLPEDHPVVEQITKARWQLTRRGFGPWARIYRKAQGRERQCVQLAILPWGALDERSWPGVADMHPSDIARALGIYAERVITPRGGAAVNGLELMTALRPPTRAVRDQQTGNWVSAHNPGSLGTEPMDPAPPEAREEHPLVHNSGWTGGYMAEEALRWTRPIETLTGDEVQMPYAIGLDLNTAFLAAAARLVVGLSAPDHFHTPAFNPKIPGTWLVDLSHVEIDPRLPSPFTQTGERPTGPAWYQTHTVAYAQELGYNVAPIEAYLRRETGAYLDPWHDRLKTAYVDTLADLGVTKDLTDAQFLQAMEQRKNGDPVLNAVLAAVKGTIKGGIGKLNEGPHHDSYRDGEPWPAMMRPTWRPDIRAAVIAKARVNMHRKMRNMATMTGRYPLAVLSDCVVYPAPTDHPMDMLPYAESGKIQPGAFRLGPTPGLAKLEGVQSMAWAVDLIEQGMNPASHIKGGNAVLDDGE
ncbi:telomere-associated protein Tap [Streptomyces diastaticus]